MVFDGTKENYTLRGLGRDVGLYPAFDTFLEDGNILGVDNTFWENIIEFLSLMHETLA
jgi:hypothetical protein